MSHSSAAGGSDAPAGESPTSGSPASPVSARAPVPPGLRYTGPLPSARFRHAPPAPTSDNVWRNLAVTLATVVVLALGGVVIFWPKDGTPGSSAGDAAALTAPASEPGPAAAAGAPAGPAGPSGTSRTSAGAATSYAGPPPSGAAMPTGDLPGWRQTFSEDFNGGDLGQRWYTYEGQPGGDPGGWFLPSHVAQRNGRLVIAGSREDTPNGSIYATGGISNAKSFTQTYGRFEFRFRMDKGYGINYVLLLWPSDDVWPPEINVAEDDGLSRDLITATLHYGQNNSTLTRKSRGAADFTTWHTAGVQWRPGSLAFTLDGAVWATIPSPNVPKTPMSIAVQSQAWPCGTSFSDCPNSTTPATVNLEVDWVVAYAAA